jgi:hypothetical protein
MDYGTGASYYGVYQVLHWTPPVDGTITQIKPIASSTIAYNVDFTGTYNNSAGWYYYMYLNITNTTDGTPTENWNFPLPALIGNNIPYDLYLPLSPNKTYSYELVLANDTLNDIFTVFGYPTASVSFSTSALMNDIAPVWEAEACTWVDFSTWTGCFDNLFHSLFSPTTESLNQFNGLYDQYIHKPPFGYVSAIQTTLVGLNDTGTSVFTLQSLPVLNTYIFNPIRIALAWIFWLAFAFVLYHRLKNISL